MKVDQTNTDPAYWEKVLASQKLSPLEEDESTTPEAVPQLHELRQNMPLDGHRTINKDYQRLRTVVDVDDPFIARGHRIRKERVWERETPSWAADNSELRKIIDMVFPKWRENQKQRQQAGRWIRVVYLFYRVHLPRTHVAADMKLPEETVKNILKRIKRAARGQRSDNAGVRSR